MRRKRLDLNLLLALDALLTERSITRAAACMFITQPAMSNALARLRKHFGDDLVTRSGRKLVLTPRAESLIVPVREVLTRIDSLVEAPSHFNPRTSERQFTLLMSNYAMSVLIDPLLRRFASTAPSIRFVLLSLSSGVQPDELERNDIDLLIIPEQYRLQHHPSLRLFEESYVCVTWSGNDRVHDRLSLADYLAAGHVVTQFGDGRPPMFDSSLLKQLGLERRAEVVVASLTAPAQMVVGTQRIATVDRRLAETAARQGPITIWPAPLEIPKLVEYAQWNKVRGKDPGLRWLMSELRSLSASI